MVLPNNWFVFFNARIGFFTEIALDISEAIFVGAKWIYILLIRTYNIIDVAYTFDHLISDHVNEFSLFTTVFFKLLVNLIKKPKSIDFQNEDIIIILNSNTLGWIWGFVVVFLGQVKRKILSWGFSEWFWLAAETAMTSRGHSICEFSENRLVFFAGASFLLKLQAFWQKIHSLLFQTFIWIIFVPFLEVAQRHPLLLIHL